MTLWQRFWRLIKPAPTMCRECGDFMRCTSYESFKGIAIEWFECCGCQRQVRRIRGP